MAKYFIFPDNTRIPIDDISDQTSVICYPENMEEVKDVWQKLTPETTNHQIGVNDEESYEIFNPDDLKFNKIELETCSTGILMRIIFASSAEEEFRKLLEEKEELERAYNIIFNGKDEEEELE